MVPPYSRRRAGVCYVGEWGAEVPALADSDGSRMLYCGVARNGDETAEAVMTGKPTVETLGIDTARPVLAALGGRGGQPSRSPSPAGGTGRPPSGC